MKRTIMIMLCCLSGTALFAQGIPADSLDYYRKAAHRMLIDNNTSEAVELYKRLTLSGDALSGYQLYDLYSQGKGVKKDEVEAQKWQSMAQEIVMKNEPRSRVSAKPDKDKPVFNEPQSPEALLNTSGALIERGAREHNAALIVGLLGESAGGALMGIGISQQANGLTITGGIIAGGCGVAALVLTIVGNNHISRGGELLRRVRITGGGVSVSF